MDPVLNLERGGHRVILDNSDRTGSPHYRVTCNGVVCATFAADSGDPVRDLQDALEYFRKVEVRCVENPKP